MEPPRSLREELERVAELVAVVAVCVGLSHDPVSSEDIHLAYVHDEVTEGQGRITRALSQLDGGIYLDDIRRHG